MTRTRVYLEVGAKRVFACALDWPGWCRVAKGEAAALMTLAEYADRYAPVADRAGVKFAFRGPDDLEIVERLAGDASTDFGVIGRIAADDCNPTSKADAMRIASLVDSAWRELDAAKARAPAELRKGPRGGGRDRDKMYAHVVDAEATYYVRRIGLKLAAPEIEDTPAIEAARKAILDVLSRPSDGLPPVEKGWPTRYAARRIAWHALDHAWEMEDRSQPGE